MGTDGSVAGGICAPLPQLHLQLLSFVFCSVLLSTATKGDDPRGAHMELTDTVFRAVNWTGRGKARWGHVGCSAPTTHEWNVSLSQDIHPSELWLSSCQLSHEHSFRRTGLGTENKDRKLKFVAIFILLQLLGFFLGTNSCDFHQLTWGKRCKVKYIFKLNYFMCAFREFLQKIVLGHVLGSYHLV